MKDYLIANKKLWNEKTKHHVNSEFYDVSNFLKGKTSLNDIELNLLPRDLKGKKILHLQCHFGQDSISLARMGAEVTGVDLSDEAIKEARLLADKMNVDVNFICSDIYDLQDVLEGQYDIVFTSYGAIPWLPDLSKWAQVVAHFLKNSGRLIFVEFHPFVWTFDDDFKFLKYDYFNREAIVEVEEGTYANREAAIKQKSVTWNHPLSEVMSSLLELNLKLEQFDEYDYSPYPCFKETVKIAERKYHIRGVEGKLPLVYSLVFQK